MIIMAKLTPEIKKFIEINSNLSNRDLAGVIEVSFSTKITHAAIGRYKKKYLESQTFRQENMDTLDTFPSSRVDTLDTSIPGKNDDEEVSPWRKYSDSEKSKLQQEALSILNSDRSGFTDPEDPSENLEYIEDMYQMMSTFFQIAWNRACRKEDLINMGRDLVDKIVNEVNK